MKITETIDKKIKWWEEQLFYWTDISVNGEFTNRHIDRNTGEIIEKGVEFDKDHFSLVRDEIKSCEEHLEYLYGVKEGFELLQKYIDKYGKEI